MGSEMCIRDRFEGLARLFAVASLGNGARGEDQAGGDGIDADALGAELASPASCQHDQGSLGHASMLAHVGLLSAEEFEQIKAGF